MFSYWSLSFLCFVCCLSNLNTANQIAPCLHFHHQFIHAKKLTLTWMHKPRKKQTNKKRCDLFTFFYIYIFSNSVICQCWTMTIWAFIFCVHKNVLMRKKKWLKELRLYYLRCMFWILKEMETLCKWAYICLVDEWGGCKVKHSRNAKRNAFIRCIINIFII